MSPALYFCPVMILFYNLFIFLSDKVMKLASLFHPKAKAFVSGRKNLFQKLEKTLSEKAPTLWIHCASLGEFEQGRPIIEAIKEEFPHYRIVLSFFSPSGYEVRKNYPLAHLVCYLPWDTPFNARHFIRIVRPDLAIFVKYEFWLHYARELKKQGIPLLSVSSIFRKDQLFFKPYGKFHRDTLRCFSHFFVQNKESVALLQSIGITSCTLAGDTRFDRVHHIVKQGDEIPIARMFKADQKVFVVGSCWPEDLDVLVPFINENKLKFIIAPHEPSESFISGLEKSLEVKSIRYSQAADRNLDEYQVLIIDNVGMLSRLYRYGEFAYIGGGFGKGLHNILEAACYGIPVLFGNKNYEKFQEAVDLINRGGAFDISDYPDLKAKYEILNTPETFLLACDVTRQYIEENLGATRKIMDYCKSLLKKV